jgi:hypothetical protein
VLHSVKLAGETIETWINDEGSALLIKANDDDHIWMWTKSQE